MADFDSFLAERNGIRALNAPTVTTKMEGATEWESYDHYFLERGKVDICFPSNF